MLDDKNLSFPTSGDLAIKRNILLSGAHARTGHAQQSEFEIQQAITLAQTSHSALEGEALRTEGALQQRRNEQSEAETSYRRSLDIARRQHDGFLEASDLLNLGRVALQTEHLDEALDRFKSSSQIAATLDARIVLMMDLGNAGWAYYRMGDFENALENFQNAGQQARKLGATDSQIVWLNSAGLALYQLDTLKEAANCYQQALDIAEKTQNKALVAETDTSLGLLLLQLNQLDAAKTHADEALKVAQETGDTEPDALLLSGLIALRQDKGAEAERIFFQVYRDAAQEPSLRWAAENALANRYAAQHQTQRAEQWYLKSIDTFESQRASVAEEEEKLPFFANGDALYRDYADFLIASNRSNDALQLLDFARARTLEEGLGISPNSVPSKSTPSTHLALMAKPWRTVAEADAGAINAARRRSDRMDAQSIARKLQGTIFFYSLGPQRSYLWLIQATGTRLFALPPEAEINSRVRKYQASVLKSADLLQKEDPESSWLYDTLVAPAESLIPKDSHVFLISNGNLNGLNFEMLLKPDQGGRHYWIEDVNITNASSIRLLSRFADNSFLPKDSRSSIRNLLLIGDPVEATNEYGPLNDAVTEVDNIQRYFASRDKTVITKTAAVPSAYVSNRPERYSYIHFVAHATASRLSPLDSAVVLSPSPTHPDEFKLYARDILRQPLHARLVTISACFGSGQRSYADEGLVGLSWAFLRAGAHSVIGALWEVNDSATPLLMDQLYHELEEGRDPSDALRTAKLSLIHSRTVYRKPLYWAAFELYAGS